MGSVPMWLHDKFALTLSADTLLVESQLHLISWWAVSADFPAVCVYSLVASNTDLIYCLQGYLGERATQLAATPLGS